MHIHIYAFRQNTLYMCICICVYMYMCVCCLHVCMYTMCACVPGASRGQIPWNWRQDDCELPYECWKLNLGPL